MFSRHAILENKFLKHFREIIVWKLFEYVVFIDISIRKFEFGLKVRCFLQTILRPISVITNNSIAMVFCFYTKTESIFIMKSSMSV